MLTDSLTLLAGLLFMLLLGEAVVRSGMDMARHFHLSGTFVGLTVLSIGTSIPEIFAHVVGSIRILREPATLPTMSGLLIGANIGSDIFQQNFVLPAIGLVGTILIRRRDLFGEVGALVAASLLLWVLALEGTISRIDSALLLLAYGLYLIWFARTDRTREDEIGAGITLGNGRLLLSATLLVLGFVLMGVVTDTMLRAAGRLVDMLPVSASFFGVIVLGIASAMPELSTAVMSLLKGQRGLSAGILIGSNITNPLLGIGLGGAMSTYAVPDVIVFYDLPVKIGTALMLFLFLWTRERLETWECGTLIGTFVVYIVGRQAYFPADVGP